MVRHESGVAEDAHLVFTSFSCHFFILHRFYISFRSELPNGNQPTFVWDNVLIPIPTITEGRSLSPSSFTHKPLFDASSYCPEGSVSSHYQPRTLRSATINWIWGSLVSKNNYLHDFTSLFFAKINLIFVTSKLLGSFLRKYSLNCICGRDAPCPFAFIAELLRIPRLVWRSHLLGLWCKYTNLPPLQGPSLWCLWRW